MIDTIGYVAGVVFMALVSMYIASTLGVPLVLIVTLCPVLGWLAHTALCGWDGWI